MAVVVLDEELQLIAEGMPSSDEQIVEFIGQHRRAMVAIDAPLGCPVGTMLTWKRLGRAGARLSKSKERLCERELARLDVVCYYSARRSIIKKIAYRGTWLKDHLTSQGYELIDVYRYASKVRLLGRLPPKTTTEGSCTLQQHLHRVIPPIPHPKEQLLSHDVLDAALAA